jgi:hypothetical protein
MYRFLLKNGYMYNVRYHIKILRFGLEVNFAHNYSKPGKLFV